MDKGKAFKLVDNYIKYLQSNNIAIKMLIFFCHACLVGKQVSLIKAVREGDLSASQAGECVKITF
jgi:hypothetical protein